MPLILSHSDRKLLFQPSYVIIISDSLKQDQRDSPAGMRYMSNALHRTDAIGGTLESHRSGKGLRSRDDDDGVARIVIGGNEKSSGGLRTQRHSALSPTRIGGDGSHSPTYERQPVSAMW